MTKIRWIAGGAIAAVLAAAGAYAAPDRPPTTRTEVQARVAEHFKKLDANGDGYVTQAEADAAQAKMREKFDERREAHRAQEFAMLDKDKNGSLSKEEFMAPPPRGERMGGPGKDRDGRGHGRHGMMRHGMGEGGMGGAWFARADTNKDGKVSLAEATATALSMFDKVDTNHDGTISPEERDAARAAMRAKWQEHRDAGKG